jgi:large subunit ribosomal protein L10e
MGLRKAVCYRIVKRAYSRKSKKRTKSYIKTIPPSKIAKFNMGDVEKYNKGGFSHKILIVTKKPIQIRDNAIEASRQLILRHLEKNFKKDFYMEVNAHPHHILRENKMLTGAGADRMQTGMQHSFGKPVGVAAQLSKKGKIFTIVCNEKDIPLIRKIIKKAKPKLPKEKAIIVEKIQ